MRRGAQDTGRKLWDRGESSGIGGKALGSTPSWASVSPLSEGMRQHESGTSGIVRADSTSQSLRLLPVQWGW